MCAGVLLEDGDCTHRGKAGCVPYCRLGARQGQSMDLNFKIPPNTTAAVAVPGGKSGKLGSGAYTRKVGQTP